MKALDFTYFISPAAIYTFEQPKLKAWVEKRCEGKVLNLFAGKIRLRADEYRVDISNEFQPDVVMDAQEFVTTTEMKFDTVIFDPPYNWRKSRECYNGNYIGSEKKLKDALMKIINDNGVVMSFGYDSVGMSAIRGFKKFSYGLACHNGNIHDTIFIAERKVNRSIT